MKAIRVAFLALISSFFLAAQTPPSDPPIVLEDLLTALRAPKEAFEISDIREAIQRNGIQFYLRDEELGRILEAGAKGNRDPKEMAALIKAALSACQDCRAHYFTPMSPEELQTLLKRFTPEAVFREARARGITGLEPTEATQNAMRAWGAKEDLIAFLLPDDKIRTIPPQPPYKAASLKPAQDYDSTAKEGWLKITAELAPGSQSEFYFKHNALFVKPIQGEEPKDVQAFFNKPAPRNKTAEFVDVECGLESPAATCAPEAKDEKRGGLRILPKNSKPKATLIEQSYAAPVDGRAGFQITVTNPEKTAQKYSVYLRWRERDTPKPQPPSLGSGKR